MQVLTKPVEWIRTLARAVHTVRVEIVFFAGVALLATGAWWIYPPSGLIVAGLVLIWVAIPTRHFPVVFGSSRKEPK